MPRLLFVPELLEWVERHPFSDTIPLASRIHQEAWLVIEQLKLTANLLRLALVYLIDSYKVPHAISRDVLLEESESMLREAKRRLA